MAYTRMVIRESLYKLLEKKQDQESRDTEADWIDQHDHPESPVAREYGKDPEEPRSADAQNLSAAVQKQHGSATGIANFGTFFQREPSTICTFAVCFDSGISLPLFLFFCPIRDIFSNF